jgi:hypothetical protein
MLRATVRFNPETKMEFDLVKAILLKEHRKGKLFLASPSLLRMVNERIDRLSRESVGQRVERGNQAQASGPSGSGEPSGAVV